MVREDFITAAGFEYSADMVLKINTDPMSASIHFYDKPLPTHLDPKTVLIYLRTL